MDTPLPHDYESAREAAAVLNRHGFAAYIIGGAVRDMWLGLEPKDFDLVTNAMPDQIMAIDEFRQSRYKDPAQAFGVTRVHFTHRGTGGELEIATFRKDLEAHRGRKATRVVFAELEDDVSRRDFTINALALDPLTGCVTDYVGGIDDLESKIIRFIGRAELRIKEDPLRLMRAIRFRNQLGFSYDDSTAKAIKQAVRRGSVEDIATDRLRDELTAMLVHPGRRLAVRDLYDFGILEHVLPEVTAGRGIDQPPQFHSEGDVLQHELLTLNYLPARPSRRLAWAALLHDIGKPPTATPPRDAHDRIRFNRHYAIGAEMSITITRRLNFSNRDTRDISWMIYNHMAIDDLPSMRPAHQRRMLGHPAFADLLELHKADAAASWRPGPKNRDKPEFLSIEKLWHEYQAKTPEQQPSLKRDLSIDGDWLLKNFSAEFDLKPGPLIGEVLCELDEWYQDQKAPDVKAARTKTGELLKKLTGNR